MTPIFEIIRIENLDIVCDDANIGNITVEFLLRKKIF